MAISFKGAHFPPEVILMGVRWYVAYPLSYWHVASGTLQWAIFPPERTDVGLALFSVEEVMQMREHRHG
jgi:hypothetical protein